MVVCGQDLSINRFVKVEHKAREGCAQHPHQLCSLLDGLTALKEGS